jgi:hypothetical protein
VLLVWSHSNLLCCKYCTRLIVSSSIFSATVSSRHSSRHSSRNPSSSPTLHFRPRNSRRFTSLLTPPPHSFCALLSSSRAFCGAGFPDTGSDFCFPHLRAFGFYPFL